MCGAIHWGLVVPMTQWDGNISIAVYMIIQSFNSLNLFITAGLMLVKAFHKDRDRDFVFFGCKVNLG